MTHSINTKYPLQEHLDVDATCVILEFPAKDSKKCQHSRVSIDSKLNELKCKDCGANVNPVIWIKDNIHFFKAIQERSVEMQNNAKTDYEELKNRAKTKCDHCGKMTGIKLKNNKFKVVSDE